MSESPARGVLFDVDGTLVDSTYLHVVAWWQAFRDAGITIPMRDLHRRIGMGAPRLVQDTLGRHDEGIVEGHSSRFEEFLDDVTALPGAVDLLRTCAGRGLTVVLATSAGATEVESQKRALEGAGEALAAITSSEDAEESKPDPEILLAALTQAGLEAENCVFVGDTVWDVVAASEAGMSCIGLLVGGIGEDELRNAGAVEVYESAEALLTAFDASPLGALATRPVSA